MSFSEIASSNLESVGGKKGGAKGKCPTPYVSVGPKKGKLKKRTSFPKKRVTKM